MRNGTFKLLTDQPYRIKKLFLDNDRLEYEYKWVDENKIRLKEKRVYTNTQKALDFLKDLDSF